MKYNPAQHTITRDDGSPFASLHSSVSTGDAFDLLDTLVDRADLVDRIDELEHVLESVRSDRRSLEGELEAHRRALEERDILIQQLRREGEDE